MKKEKSVAGIAVFIVSIVLCSFIRPPAAVAEVTGRGENPSQIDTTPFTNRDEQISIEMVDAVTWQLIEAYKQWDVISPYLPYMSSDNVQKIADYTFDEYKKNNNPIPDISIYLGSGKKSYSKTPLTRGIIDDTSLKIMQNTGTWEFVEPWFALMTSKGVEDVVSLYISKGGDNKIAKSADVYFESKYPESKDNNSQTQEASEFDYSSLTALDNLTQLQVDALALEYIEKTSDFRFVYNMRPYMSQAGIDSAVRVYISNGGQCSAVSAMLEYMSKEVAHEIAEKYYAEEYGDGFDYLYKPYI